MDPDGGVLKFGRFELDLARRELRRDGVPVELQRAPLNLLLYLAEHRDRAVPKEELLDELWRGSAVTDSSVSNALNQLRIAVDDDGRSQRVIRTGRGRGYRFVAVGPEATDSSATRHRSTPWLAGTAALLLLAGLVAWWLGRAPALPPIRSVAVLPLENLSGDPDQEYVADAMTDALIGELAKIGSLRVISRTSVMHYKGGRKTASQIAGELDVEGLIVGSVVREGTRIRINLQLVDGRAEAVLWTRSYERDLRSVLALSSEIALAVSTQIRIELTPREEAFLTASRSVDPEAYDAYMRAMQLLGAGDLTTIILWGPEAIGHLERAVGIDPEFAEAWGTLGQAHLLLSLRDFSDREAGEKARRAIQRALELDERLGRAHAFLGQVLRFYDWDFAAAKRAFERGVELSPNDYIALLNYASFLGEVEGRTQEALAVSSRMALLAPFSLSASIRHGHAFVWHGQCERALEEFDRVRERLPGWRSEVELFCFVQLGRHDEAYRMYLDFLEGLGPRGERGREAMQRGWADGGWPGAMRAGIEATAQRQDVNPAAIAMTYAWIGEVDEAFAWLERAYHARDPMITGLKSIFFSQLRSDPRYDDLARRIGLPEG